MIEKTAFVVGDSFFITSGLTYVAKNIARILKAMGYRVKYLSCSGLQHDETEEAVFIGNSLQEFDKQVALYRPSLVVTVHDPWMIVYTAISQYKDTYCLVNYQPVEADYYPENVIFNMPDEKQVRPISIKQVFERANHIIAYNEFGAKGLAAMGIQANDHIPNGIDESKAGVIDNKDAITQRRVSLGLNPGSILFMTMGRNSSRKRQDVLIDAWRRFVDMHRKQFSSPPNAKLYMHCDQYTPNGFDLPNIIKRFGVQDSVVMPGNIQFPEQELKLFYNACDIYVGVPGGEGHGYGFMEAMAAGKPLVYGDYGGHTTFCEGCGIGVKPMMFVSAQNIDAPRAIINPKTTAEAMMTLYLDKAARKQYGEVGLEKSKQYYWNKLDDRFAANFEAAMANFKSFSVFRRRVA